MADQGIEYAEILNRGLWRPLTAKWVFVPRTGKRVGYIPAAAEDLPFFWVRQAPVQTHLWASSLTRSPM